MIWPARESTAYRSRLLAFDQKGLDQVRNVGFSYWLQKKKDILQAQKVFKGF